MSASSVYADFLKERVVLHAEDATHLCMKGSFKGKFCIPEDDHEEFYRLYVQAIESNYVSYLTERCTNLPRYKFYLDIDFPYSLHLPDMNKVVGIIKEVVPDNSGYIWSRRNHFKHHFNFPECYVTPEEATSLAIKLQKVLTKHCPVTLACQPDCKATDRKLATKWDTFLDTSVYNSGLRLLGSRKNYKNKSTEAEEYKQHYLPAFKKAGLDPPFGDKPNDRDFGLYYKICYIDGIGEIQNTDKPSLQDMLMTTIRYGLPTWKGKDSVISKALMINQEEVDEFGEQNDADIDGEVQIGGNDFPFIPKDTRGKLVPKDIQTKLEPFILEYYHHHSGHITSMKMKRHNEKLYLQILTDERQCYFIQGKHKSNHQYIIVGVGQNNHLYMAQRCWDEVCKSKSYHRQPVPKEMENILADLFELKRPDEVDDIVKRQAHECTSMLYEVDDSKVITPFRVAEIVRNDHTCKALIGTYVKSAFICKQPCVGDEMEVVMCEHGINSSCCKCKSSFPPNGSYSVPVQFNYVKQYFVNVSINVYCQPEISDPLDFIKDQYEMFKDSELNYTFLKSLWGTHSLLAKLLFELYQDQFRVDMPVNAKNPIWYEFNGTVWKPSNKLHTMIFHEDYSFIKYFYTILNHYKGLGDDDDKDIKKKVVHIQKVIDNLQSHKFQESLMNQCAFYWEHAFPKFLDTVNQKNIAAFTNGVYDFDTLEFRDGRPEDNLTMTTYFAYKPFDPNDPHVQMIMKFLHDILPDPAVVEYMLKALSTCLTTDVSQQKFYMLTGEGGNGKSLLQDLIKESVGDYVCIADACLITKTRESASRSNEALMSCLNKRIVFFNEVSKDAKIQADIMKMFTGGDTITARENFGHQKEFKVLFKSFLICNKQPELTENGHSEWRRVRVIDFPMKFVADPDPNEPNERKIDYNLGKKLKEACGAFLSILVEYYGRYIKDGLVEPKAVLEHTKKYQDQNDKFKAFIDQCFIAVPEGSKDFKESIIETAPTFDAFSQWHLREYGIKGPNWKEYRAYLNQKFKNQIKQIRIPANLKEQHGDRTHVIGLVGYKFVQPVDT